MGVRFVFAWQKRKSDLGQLEIPCYQETAPPAVTWRKFYYEYVMLVNEYLFRGTSLYSITFLLHVYKCTFIVWSNRFVSRASRQSIPVSSRYLQIQLSEARTRGKDVMA